MKNGLDGLGDRRGLSRAELAENVGVTRQTIDSTERGRYDPSLELAFKLAEYSDCRIKVRFDPEID